MKTILRAGYTLEVYSTDGDEVNSCGTIWSKDLEEIRLYYYLVQYIESHENEEVYNSDVFDDFINENLVAIEKYNFNTSYAAELMNLIHEGYFLSVESVQVMYTPEDIDVELIEL